METEYKEGYFKGYRNTKLFYRNWTVKEKKANVIFLHGFGDHSARYGHFAAYLNKHNISLYSFDLRGHGKSEGPRFNVECFDYFLEDLTLFIKHIKSENAIPHKISNFVGDPTLENVFFIGYSMGSTIALKYLINSNSGVHGVILVSPALGVHIFNIKVPNIFINAMNYFVGPVMRTLETVASIPILGTKIYYKYLTHNVEEAEAFKKDTLVNQETPKLRMGLEISKSTVEVNKMAINLKLPILILYGKADKIIPTKSIKSFYSRLKTNDKKCIEYPDLYHDLLHEIAYEKVYTDILKWINDRL